MHTRTWGAHRAEFSLDPSWTFLNHGSFGATPRSVQAVRRGWLDRMEAQPVQFLARDLPELLHEARAPLARFLGTSPDQLAFVGNATTGIAAVLGSLTLGAGDVLLTTDHRYNAVFQALQATAHRAGASVECLSVGASGIARRADLLQRLEDRLRSGPRPRLLVISQITSPTAICMPVEQVCALARRHGVAVLVDGAHAPGQITVDLDTLGADYWVGNLHKWLCAPKGTALLWVGSGLLSTVHCPQISHGRGQGFHQEFDWPGTFDPSAWLSAPAALAQHEAWGGPDLRAAHHELAQIGLQTLLDEVDSLSPVCAPDSDAYAAMATVRLPLPASAAFPLMAVLRRHHIEVPVQPWWDSAWLRISAFAAHNRPEQYTELAAVLPAAMAEVQD